eukprot:TRINITY_DN1653_c0_g2_i1.p1 TRINITY_DN1653_c0_g2~~TRINITY_DN1653_c0_g2_i1.p1  ORF type:complete len:373 (-),score=131.54 TRINITY_DN1653_c0_g2_i1:45-1163(-)
MEDLHMNADKQYESVHVPHYGSSQLPSMGHPHHHHHHMQALHPHTHHQHHYVDDSHVMNESHLHHPSYQNEFPRYEHHMRHLDANGEPFSHDVNDPNNLNVDGVTDMSGNLSHHMLDMHPSQKKRKHDKESQLNTCLALGCERQIKQRRLCPMHQKQKERSQGKLELKENVKFAKGRTPTPFSKHANKYAKLKTFDKKVDEWAGGREEGTLMLEAYMDSSYHQTRFPKQEDTKIYEQIGKNIVDFMKQLPEKSPLRRPLIKAMSENVPLARLREVLPVSKQTVINSKKLSDQDNLLLTIKYKPNVTRARRRENPDNGEDVSDESIVSHLVGPEDMTTYGHPQMGGPMTIGSVMGVPPISALPTFNLTGNPNN